MRKFIFSSYTTSIYIKHFAWQWIFFFLDLTPKAKTMKQNKQVRLHQTKKLLHSKGIHQQNEKPVFGMEGNICKSHTP